MAALITIALAGTVTYLSTSSTAAVRSVLEESEGSASTVMVQTRISDDPAAQDTAVRSAAEDLLPGAAVTSTVRTPPLAVAGTEADVVLLDDATLAEHATLSEGEWPAAPAQGALHAEAAESLEVQVGDELTIGEDEQRIQVTGLWQPDDPQAGHWGGDLLVEHGTDPLAPATFGPLLVSEEDIGSLDLDPFVNWAIGPGTSLAPDQVDPWIDGLEELQPRLEEADFAVRGLTVTGSLRATLNHMSSGLASVSAAATVPLVIVVAVSLVATWQIARLLSTVRERENRLLRSRGGSYRQLIGTGAGEALVVMGVGGLIGALVVLIGLGTRAGSEPMQIVLLAVAVVLVTAAILTAVHARATVRALEPTTESGRTGTLLATGVLVLLTLAAAFTLWRFGRNASPLVPGTSTVDPLAVSGPALALLAAALLAVALAGPILRWLAERAARRPGYEAVAALRQAARRIALTAVPVILVVLATGVATLAGTYAGTATALRTMSAAVSNGADVRVQFGSAVAGDSGRGLADYAGLPGVDASTGVITESVLSGETAGTLTAIDTGELDVSSAPPGVLDPEQAAVEIGPAEDPLPGLDVPEGAEQVQVEVTAAADSGTQQLTGATTRAVDLRVMLWNGSEAVTAEASGPRPRAEGVEAGRTIERHNAQGRPVTREVTVDLPASTGQPWRIVAIDAVLDAALQNTDYEVSIGAVTADGEDLLTQAAQEWDVVELPFFMDGASVQDGEDPFALTATTVPFTLGHATGTGVENTRFMPPGDEPDVPALVTPGWSSQVLETGTDISVAGTDLRMHAAGEIPVVPGEESARGVLVDLPSLQAALLRSTVSARAVSEVWLATGDQQGVTAEAAALAGPRAEVTAAEDFADDPVSAPARAVYWIAAVCALLLALPAVVAVALTQASARRGEVVVLRAVGVGSAQQGRTRRAELLGLELAAVATGILTGLGISALIMTDLVRATSPQTSAAVPLTLTASWLAVILLLAAIVITVVAVAFWYARTVRRQVLDLTWREEIR